MRCNSRNLSYIYNNGIALKMFKHNNNQYTNIMAKKYLTKSRFKLATKCPTKLYYTGKSEYPDQNAANDFLQQLAEGGYQVGKLAEYKFPGGENIDTLDYDESLNRTNELLAKENCIIYEAAFKFNNLFIRADVVVKKSNQLDLYEVKAKSYGSKDKEFINSNGIDPNWKEYLYDVAFQKFVITRSLPKLNVNAHLTLIDKDHACHVNGMHQCFKIEREIYNIIRNGEEITREKKYIKVKENLNPSELDTDILVNKNVDAIIDKIWNGEYKIEFHNAELVNKSFEEATVILANAYVEDRRTISDITSNCAKCEFKAKPDEILFGKKDGQKICIKNAWKLTDDQLKEPLIFELWKGGMGSTVGTRTAAWIAEKKYLLGKLEREDYAPAPKKPKKGEEEEFLDPNKLSPTDRREIQISYTNGQNTKPTIKKLGLQLEFSQFKYPLHFIDFETIGTAIPFHKGLYPYEVIAFQFSHHTVSKSGEVKHANEWINVEEGAFPNFEFVRALKKAVGNEGTIFRYATHENTVLTKISEQLQASTEKDKDELIAFIKLITKDKDKIEGPRNMVDLLELVKKYYYNPLMKGSNSIKQVLPAIMNEGEFIKNKYSNTDYKSKNFPEGKMWYVLDEKGMAKDPYKLLPPINNDIDVDFAEDEESSGDGKSISSGGPAMMAYAEMQFMEIDKAQRDKLKNALLRYCELDTLAMVMIYEHWKSLIK